MERTVFERIVTGELPSWRVYEDNQTIAILDITPIHKGHTLVIPKIRYANIYELPPELFSHLMSIAQKIAIRIKKNIRPDGVNILMANERAAGQMIADHAHIHVIPRYDNDGFRDWHGEKPYVKGEQEYIRDLLLEDA